MLSGAPADDLCKPIMCHVARAIWQAILQMAIVRGHASGGRRTWASRRCAVIPGPGSQRTRKSSRMTADEIPSWMRLRCRACRTCAVVADTHSDVTEEVLKIKDLVFTSAAE